MNIKKLQLVPYHKNSIKIFKQEKERISDILDGLKYQIEHFGSTAIPGTLGKDIIDIMIIFDSNVSRLKAIKLLKDAGYFLDKNNSQRRGDRIFFSNSEKESNPGDTHIHLVIKNSKEHINPLLFRNYLLKNKQCVKEYNNLKNRLSVKLNLNRKEYTKNKSDFINKIIELVKK